VKFSTRVQLSIATHRARSRRHSACNQYLSLTRTTTLSEKLPTKHGVSPQQSERTKFCVVLACSTNVGSSYEHNSWTCFPPPYIARSTHIFLLLILHSISMNEFVFKHRFCVHYVCQSWVRIYTSSPHF